VTQINGLAAEIQSFLDNYYTIISDKVEFASKSVANDLAEHLRTSPESPDKTGDYKKGWRVKPQSRRGRKIYIVHNKTDYQLTHLLEKGHALRRGGRQIGQTREFPHIKPAAKLAVDDFLDRLKGIIRE
jgi:bacteriophage HK97-gp10 putative tail-component